MTCTDCGAPATCRYDLGTGERYGCAGHDPVRSGLTVTLRVLSYQSIPQFPVLATTGHLGVCNCAYGAQTAVCPVHPPVRPVVIC